MFFVRSKIIIYRSYLKQIKSLTYLSFYTAKTSKLHKMEKLEKVVLKPLDKSIYVKPLTLSYVQDGKSKTWDFLQVHDSVAIILYNISRGKLILVKQFRPPVYIGSIPAEDRKGEIDVQKYPARLGVTIELCAGICDKDIPLENIAAEEVFEECGYKVDPKSLEKVSSYRSGVGTSGSIQTLYYCEVTDNMKDNQGGGIDEEYIEIIEMSVEEVRTFMKSDHILAPPSFLFGIQWFLSNKVPKNKL